MAEMKDRGPYTEDDVRSRALDYFNGDDLAATTWMNKYALRDHDGRFLESSPVDMHRRMAREFARVEAAYPAVDPGRRSQLSEYGRDRKGLDEERIFALFDGFREVVPQGSIMASLGDPWHRASLSNCVVIPSPYDSYGGIFRTDQQLAQLCKRRCGVGFDLGTLRPQGAPVTNPARSSSGAAGFMERFSNTTREVSQAGRRGALMLTMDIAHPDVERFILMKQDLAKVTGANVSVRVGDDFLRAVEGDAMFVLRWPLDAAQPQIRRPVRARDLWNTLVTCAHRTGEPGVIFWDRQHHYSTSSMYPGFRNESTNPCGEVAMQGGDSCRLMVIDLLTFVTDAFTPAARFDHDRLSRVTYEAQRLMDDLVDLEIESVQRILAKVERDPEPLTIKQVELDTWRLLLDNGRRGRRTGLGCTGLADALAALGIRYGSADAMAVTEAIMRTKCRAEFESSIDMAIERGPFAAFDPSVERTSGFVAMLAREMPDLHARMMLHGRRNISISTIAPGGTLSLLTRTSSGIEPLFRSTYVRRRKVAAGDAHAVVAFTDEVGDRWEEFTVHHPGLMEWMRTTGRNDISESPYADSTADRIDPQGRLRLQAVVQKYITHSISSTINLPVTCTVDDVADIFIEAWRLGLKGVTVYREGSRNDVLVAGQREKTSGHQGPVRMPTRIPAEVFRFLQHDTAWIATVGLVSGRPAALFLGQAGEALELPEWVTHGWLVELRDASGHGVGHSFEYVGDDGVTVNRPCMEFMSDTGGMNCTMLLNALLRMDLSLPKLVDIVAELVPLDERSRAWRHAVVHVLSGYMGKEAGVGGGQDCPECA